MREQISGEIMFQHGKFPSSARKRSEKTSRKSVQVFDSEDTETCAPQFSPYIENSVKTSWAILLRTYIRSNFVTFAVISAVNQEILNYQLSDHQRLVDICASRSQEYENDIFEDIPVNTAIDYTESPRGSDVTCQCDKFIDVRLCML